MADVLYRKQKTETWIGRKNIYFDKPMDLSVNKRGIPPIYGDGIEPPARYCRYVSRLSRRIPVSWTVTYH